MATSPVRRACSVCGTLLAEDSAFCPVCAFQQALGTEAYSVSNSSSELRFEHYTVLHNAEGKPFELGHGAMGVTYKAFDVHLQRPAALKIINAQLLGDESVRARFVREARAAASVRHQNVATVFHIGESSGNFYYAMELVEGESLQSLIRRSGCLEPDLALQIVEEAAAGLEAIEKQHLVHRDIKPSNIMVTLLGVKLENVKIIDLGLAKGVAEENTLSAVGVFVGTPAYASPEQFAGMVIDIRSDLYSLGVTLWEMVSGKLPFAGSAAELMYQHQHAKLSIEKLKNVPVPVIALLEVLLAKDPNQRFQSPAQLQQALTKVRGAIHSGSRLTPNELRSVDAEMTAGVPRTKPNELSIRWVVGVALCVAIGLLAWIFSVSHLGLFSQEATKAGSTGKSIAVLPFDNIGPNKDDAYFADGVQDEILNNLAKIAQLKVISRTSVMQYRADTKRDLRQIAAALDVATVLEGTVRRDGNQVRVSTELVDARSDNTIWADSYDRDLTDIFAIQSEIAQQVARKLTAALSPDEKNKIETKPTDNLQAYDFYLRANELIRNVHSVLSGYVGASMREALPFLEKAVQLDPKFTLAYCAIADVQDLSYHFDDPTPERRALGDAAINSALQLEPDLEEVRLAYAQHLYLVYSDYERARAQLAIVKHVSPNNSQANFLEALIDRRQGKWEKAVQQFKEATKRDPSNTILMAQLSATLSATGQFAAAQRAYDRLIELVPDQPKLKILRAYNVEFKRGDETPLRSAIAAIPASMTDDDVLCWGLELSLCDHDWQRARELIEKVNGGEDPGYFAWGDISVPIGCYSILLARLEGKQPDENPSFFQTRAELNQKIQRSRENASLLSQLAVVDALLNDKEVAIAEAKRAVEILPISKDAVSGPGLLVNLAVVYAWTDEVNLAFQTLGSLTKTPAGISYGELKLGPYFNPLRNDPRFDKLLGELVPRD